MSTDQNIDTLYAAVGRAMSAWETVEAHLSNLYSIAVKSPTYMVAMKSYGRDSKIFTSRMSTLAKAAASYFAKHPSQEHEGTLAALIAEARELSTKRNDIAHGIVCSIPIVVNENVQPGYAMVPQLYAVFRLNDAEGHYWYGSSEIDTYTERFLALADRVAKFNEILNPKL
jgi:hypothetical protein